MLLPLFVFVLGPRLALMHAALGLAGAIVLLEALMISYDKVPFTCTYLPSENMKALAPIYAIRFLIGASLFARMAIRRDGRLRRNEGDARVGRHVSDSSADVVEAQASRLR